MRARARLARSHSWRSKMRMTASVTFRYSPLSSSRKSYSTCALRGMIEVPPPTSISTPRTSPRPSISLDARAKGDVVDAADRAVSRTAVEGGLDLARHRLRRRVAHEVAHVRARVGGEVEQLVLGHARPRIACDVAHRVAAALAAGKARLAQLADQLLGFQQGHVVHLDVLARRDVALVQRHVLLDHIGERLHLLRGDPPEGKLHADHLHVRLALAVHALLQAKLDELVFSRLSLQELRRLGLEVVVLALQDRDHVPRHVLEHLRVLQRAALGGD